MKKIYLAALVAAASASFLASCNNGSPKANLKTDADTLSYVLGMANAPSEAELKMYLSDPRTGSDSTYISEFMKGMRDGMEASSDKKHAAYMAGLQAGLSMKTGLKQVEQMVYGNDSTRHLSIKNYLAGFSHGVSGKKTALKINGQLIDKRLASNEANLRIQNMQRAVLSKQYAVERANSEKFMAKIAKTAGMKSLPGGTYYKVLSEGAGAPAKQGQMVDVVYEGRLMYGTVFDASAKHPGPDGQSVQMVVGQSIPGFDAALKAMPMGAEWEIYIPWNQAYGEQQQGPIPPFSALVFKVKVLRVSAANNAQTQH